MANAQVEPVRVDGVAVQIVFETHAITRDNEAGIATGRLPGELSEAGIRNAKDLGARRRYDGIDVIHTSDLARAVQTAWIAFADSGIPTSTDSRLRECDYGELNGAPLEALLPRTAYVDRPFPGGQSYRQVATLTARYLADLLAEHDDQRILVIAHSAYRWALEHLLLGRRLEELVDAPFGWKEGWEFIVATGWRPQ